jgi:hypothetical protein
VVIIALERPRERDYEFMTTKSFWAMKRIHGYPEL